MSARRSAQMGIKMEVKNLICINCPMGCPVTAEMEGGEVVRVSGNTCRRGEAYARKEVTDPARTVTSTVKVINGKAAVVSVKTKEDIPKEKIFDCMKILKSIQIEAPVRIGDLVVADAAGTGVDVVATKSVEKL